MRLHGSSKKEKAPVEEWKDYTKKQPERKVLKYWSMIDDVISPEEANKILEEAADEEEQETGVENEEISAPAEQRESRDELDKRVPLGSPFSHGKQHDATRLHKRQE